MTGVVSRQALARVMGHAATAALIAVVVSLAVLGFDIAAIVADHDRHTARAVAGAVAVAPFAALGFYRLIRIYAPRPRPTARPAREVHRTALILRQGGPTAANQNG